jgi:hypothetical protein
MARTPEIEKKVKNILSMKSKTLANTINSGQNDIPFSTEKHSRKLPDANE